MEEWEGFRSSLVQLITTGGGQRSTYICGLSDASRRALERDLRMVSRESASPVHMLTRASDLKLEALPGLLADRITDAPLDEPLGVCFFHDVAWVVERYSIEEILEYQHQMAALRRDYPIQMVHLYSPSAFDAKALWYCTRVHRAVWTGEAPCENFYYTSRPAPPAIEGFSFEEDLKRSVGYLQRQARMRAELVGRVVETESLLEERVTELHALNRLARILAHSQDLDEILSEALGRVLEMLGLDAGGIYVFGDGAMQTRQRVLLPVPPFTDETLTAFHEAAMNQSPGGRIWWTSDVHDSNEPFLPSKSPVRSFLVAPLKFSGETVGLLEVVGSEAHAFSLQEIHLVDVIGGQIGVAVKNARLHEKQVQAETAELDLRQQLLARDQRSPDSEVVQGLVARVEVDIAAASEGLTCLEGRKLDPTASVQIDAARSALARATRLLDEFRALDAEPDSPPQPVSLGAVLAASLEVRRSVLEQSGAETEVHVEEHLSPVMGDAGDLARLFLALIDQALAASPKCIGLAVSVEGREVVAVVEDDGAPLVAGDLSHVFEPFRAPRGMAVAGGLALAACPAIVRRHGATIEVQRAGDKTRFVLRFPVLGTPSRAAAGGARGTSDDLAPSGIC
mgnify:CR=1 FL=1